MSNLDRILKSRNIILPAKAHLGKAMVFPVVIYGCESWTINKAVEIFKTYSGSWKDEYKTKSNFK